MASLKTALQAKRTVQPFSLRADIFQEMYYLAITFIFIGLGCLLYLFVVRNFQHRTEAEPENAEPEVDPAARQARAEELNRRGFDADPESAEPEYHRNQAPAFGEEWQQHRNPHGVGQPATGLYEESQRHRLWSDTSAATAPRPGQRYSFQGVLFLDESGQAVGAAEHWKSVSPELFSKLKRMGPCQLQYSDRMFLIHSDTVRLQYRVDDLTRILFLDSGFAFIPERGGPCPLILTREVDRFKNFLRDNSL
ncbi:MAG: hypothetical protein CMN76_18240 [Spirochaetaceae bacterium]|nr:hypothetical protein [Spirochaetaceae bacterium]